MGDYYVLGLQERGRWLQELSALEGLAPDLHYRPEYCGLFNYLGEARLFVYREKTAAVIYPFLLRRVNLIPALAGKLEQDLYDITSPYGYGGPLASADAGESVLDGFSRSFAEYCRKNAIITEFIRFHPLLGNHRLLEGRVTVERASQVVCVKLYLPEEEIWAGYGRNNRKNIKKACREGLTVVIEETPVYFNDFISVYHHTLTRNQAGQFYYFNESFYEGIHRELKGNFLYAHTLKEGRIISTELLLYNETYIHSFLGGTLEQFYGCRPNNILKHEVIRWAKSRGIKYFLLGGGYRGEDGIFRYKRSFAMNGVLDFFVGKKVHDHEAVSMLEKMMAAEKPRESENYFPVYRRY
ncbi:MAG: GNAT family N-acetyltransferase [Pelotomaculum sp.]|uniref:BioF2-like acetyltransferase domain-containing protein n=1 Tax=Pelotomaculum thermopropionicum (strain DSM 13744 / JCM 10971 / SI) TaxID=370438 RepID=A5D3B9_PELTS|nr:GNAT family N-acetyltransferase [Pelotomaculum sp.]BAF59280.1 hypothetical protein PTH_1099 [Pelotomaculum thermopropionicum SI]